MTPMRRSDLAIPDAAQLDESIRRCSCCRLGFADGGRPYIVPLNFGYRREEGKPVFYFHGALEGRKVDLIRKLGFAAFELDGAHQINESDKACNYSMSYFSIMGEGKIAGLTDPDAKAAGLGVIMAQVTGRTDWDFPPAALEKTAVFRLEADELSGRAHK